jgi:Domain of unknown function (DUF4145)
VPLGVRGWSVYATNSDIGRVFGEGTLPRLWRCRRVFDQQAEHCEVGYLLVNRGHQFEGASYQRVHWRMLRCSGCGRAGLAKFHDNGNEASAVLESFLPRALASAPLPAAVPEGVVKEYREAELCASVEAWRAASALLRSTLEKALKANGYTKGVLQQKIDDAAADGVITSARRQKAHDDIRVLGNEVVHDDWRPVEEDEVEAALHYAQRVLEDLYDDRAAVEAVLKVKGRLP